MSAIASDLLEFAARYGNKVLQAQVNLRAPIWSALNKVPMSGKVGVINPVVAGQSSSTFITDGGTRSAGNSRVPVQGIVSPAFVDCPLEIGNGALMTLNGKDDSADYLDGELKSAGNTIAKQIGTAIYTPAGLMATVASGIQQFSAVTADHAVVSVETAAGFGIGMPVTLLDVSASRAYLVRVGAISLNAADAGAQITLIRDVAVNSAQTNNTKAVLDAVTFVNGDQIYVRGSLTNEGVDSAAAASSLGPVSLDDLSGSGAIYSLSATDIASTGFRGLQFTSVGDPTHEAFITRMARVRQLSGDTPDLICVSPLTAAALGFSALTQAAAVGAYAPTGGIGQTRRMVSGKLDKYGPEGISENGVSIGGVKTIQDENLAEGSAFLLNTDYTKIGLWQDIMPEKQGGDSVLIHQSKFAKVIMFSAAFNVMCNKRSTVCRLSGLTTDLI